jgi:hypothetical protein
MAKAIKNPFNFDDPKLYSVTLHNFWFWKIKILKKKAYFGTLRTPDEAHVHKFCRCGVL